MTETTRTVLVATSAVCVTIAGSTCYEGRRISDLNTALKQQVTNLRTDLNQQVTNLRDNLPGQIAAALATSSYDPTTALGHLNDRVRSLERGVQDTRREIGSALRPTLGTFTRATPSSEMSSPGRPSPADSFDAVDAWRTVSIGIGDAFNVDVSGWVSPVSQDGERLPDDDCGIEPGGILTVREIDSEGRMALVEYTIDDWTTDTSCVTGTYTFYPLP